jgi:TusA-related sulfurtransferase
LNRDSGTLTAQADYILDFRGSISPISLLKITRTFNEMKAREVVEILGLDPDTQQDLFKVLAGLSYEIIYPDREKNGDFQRLQIRKRP